MFAFVYETRQRHAQVLNVFRHMQELVPLRLDVFRVEHSVQRVMVENRLAKLDHEKRCLPRPHCAYLQDTHKQPVAPRVLDKYAAWGHDIFEKR